MWKYSCAEVAARTDMHNRCGRRLLALDLGYFENDTLGDRDGILVIRQRIRSSER